MKKKIKGDLALKRGDLAYKTKKPLIRSKK
jgi:hypothetical protein